MDERIAEIKRSLEISEDDTKLDLQLADFIKRIEAQLKVRLDFITEIPEELNYIVVESTIKRFNRVGEEGMESYSQEGQSIKYERLLAEYEADIIAWKNIKKEPRESVVRFL